MPPQKKPRRDSKKLKQTTLTGGIQSAGRARTQSSPARPAAKRRRVFDEQHDSSDTSDLGALKLEPEGDEEDTEEQLPSPVRRGKKSLVVDSDEDESEDNAPAQRRRTRSAKTKERSKTKKGDDSKKNQSNQSKAKTKAKSKQPTIILTDSDVQDSSPPRRRKLVKGARPPAKSHSDNSEESDEVDPDSIIENRFRSRNKKTEFQKNLERLKRKKQGKPMDSDEEEEDEEEEEEAVVPFKGAKPGDDRDSLFDESDDSDESKSVDSENFIVEDDGTGLASLPLEFSMESHQDLSHNFKKIFQFFVHIAVHPSIERHEFMDSQMKNEEYFSVPLNAARRKIKGLRDSLVASSVWRPEFKGPLEKYPQLDLVQLDFAVPGCDACNLGARMSTLNGRLLGEPYDRLGFEDLDISDDQLEEGDSRVEFHLGRFCARRTRVYHDLSHWEYMLFKVINDEVDDLHIAKQEKGAGRFVRVAWPGGLKPPKDLQDADGICDWLDQRKIIEMEWEKLKGYMERAQGLELAAKKGNDVD
ncbi:hypothetical protein EV361DRAFT_877176 [Lentinula raphanica]|uniref:DUF4211 domain-containing protein n=1 Tax=Lentinula raphanica TaxID=153919 RepID=A0AA38UKH5_9AGAR|nr:hypothetical protein F5880DRAFT_1525982 [Lentinula raphanica]KAJ3845082.1 hypothetical protein F5878DRAFT_572331 [Lentinula raphanica]KAJ3977706.1 hypothetical protein EV361DRAFT_877176 [Lentinula raphanica]